MEIILNQLSDTYVSGVTEMVSLDNLQIDLDRQPEHPLGSRCPVGMNNQIQLSSSSGYT